TGIGGSTVVDIDHLPCELGGAVDDDRSTLCDGLADRSVQGWYCFSGLTDVNVAGAGGLDKPRLVEGLLVVRVAGGGVAGDQHEGDVIANCVDQCSGSVGEPGAVGHCCHAQTPAAECITLGHHDCAGLVDRRDVRPPSASTNALEKNRLASP